jgi:A/G-specific adenine glycosylase
MLRRTRADQVVAVFQRFMEEFPTLEAAATANSADVERLLYPLGLAWRAQNILDFLHQAHQRFPGDLPLDLGLLRSLPGIGDYVGAAIVCFAGGHAEPLIDTNVVRVLGRLFGLNTEGEARRRADMRRLATRAVFKPDPISYHYALLDFGAKVCVARAPRCSICPFHEHEQCVYYAMLTGHRQEHPGGK